MSSEDLTAKIQFSDYNYLLGIIVYLENKGLVDIEMFIGGKFFIRLSALDSNLCKINSCN